tara:strand:- start:269 stop:1228 length:960 start_codon:yes stop_codon:yes gene_type:complete
MAYKFLSGTLGMPIKGVGPGHLAESVFSGSLLVSSSRATSLIGGGLGGISASMGVTASSFYAVGAAGTVPPSRFGALIGATIDATTDFTVGSLIITDDQIQMTPSTNDTVTIAAATNGVLNITTVDNDGTTADVNLTADGQIEYRANDAAGHIFDIAGTNQLAIIDGMIEPVTDNDIDLGSEAKSFKNAHIQGTLTVGTVTATTLNATVLDNSRSIGNANVNLGTGFNYVTTSLAADRTYFLPATSAADRGMTLTVKANGELGTSAATAFKMIITSSHGTTGKSNMLIDGAKSLELTTANSAVNLIYVGDHTGGHWKVY